MDEYSYNRREGTSGISGQIYEILLSMWFLLYGTYDQGVEYFYLATNVKESDALDDVNFKWKCKDNNCSQVMFLQAKHKDYLEKERLHINHLLSPSSKSDFGLMRYFASYRKLRNEFNKPDNIIFNDSFEQSNCFLVIFSNVLSSLPSEGIQVMNDLKIFPYPIYYKIKYETVSEEILANFHEATDCQKLGYELAILVENTLNGNRPTLDINKSIFKNYHRALNDHVLHQIKPKLGCFKKTFLEGKTSCRTAFYAQLMKRGIEPTERNFSELVLKLPDNFEIGTAASSNLLPDDLVTKEELVDFFNRLKIVPDQPGESELAELLKRRIQTELNVTPTEADLIFSDVQIKIHRWWKEGATCLTKNGRTLFERSKSNLSKLSLVSLALIQIDQIERFGLRFQQPVVDRLKDVIRDNSFLNIISKSVIFSTIKLYQTLEDMTEYATCNDEYKYMFLNSRAVIQLYDRVLDLFRFQYDLIVIEDGEDEIGANIISKLKNVTTDNVQKKVVIVSARKVTAAEAYNDGDVSLGHFESECQNQLLTYNRVYFSGRQTNFLTLLGHSITKFKELITSDLLMKIIKNENIYFEGTVEPLKDIEHFYISRTFNRISGRLSPCKLKTDIKNGYYITSVESLYTARPTFPNSRFQRLIDAEEAFHKLVTKQRPQSLHLIEYYNGNIYLLETATDFNQIRNYALPEHKEYDLDTVLKNHLVILATEPGMGKTTLLKRLTHGTFYFWSIFINLVQHSADLNHLEEKQLDNDLLIKYLTKWVKLKTPFERSLLHDHLENPKIEMLLMFDGFDEISPDYKVGTLKFLKALMKLKKKVWITTRLNMKCFLEDEFNTFAYTLQPFSPANQHEFLQRFWEYNIQVRLDVGKCTTFFDILLNKFTASINDEEQQFIGIPLFLRMIAEVFQDSFKTYNGQTETAPFPFDDTLNLSGLYKRFVEQKYYKIYREEKGKIDVTNPANKDMLNDNYRQCIKEHQKLSFFVLFPLDDVKLLFTNAEIQQIDGLIRKLKSGAERVGIITSVVDSKPIFIHRTFPEYFVADALFDLLRNDKKLLRHFLQKIDFFESKHATMRHFFNQLVSDNICFDLDLNNNIEKVETLPDCVRLRDKGGRTGLHLASSYGYLEIVKLLVEAGADVNSVDEIFSWTPIMYSDAGGFWNIVDFLLGYDSKSDLINAYKQIPTRNETLLHVCCRENYLHLGKLLIAKNADINALPKHYLGKSPLHVAAQEGHLDMIRMLVDAGADVYLSDHNGADVLHHATSAGYLNIVQYLIEIKNTSRTSTDNYNRTPLFMACENGHYEIVKVLIKETDVIDLPSNISYDSISTKLSFNWTALHVACFRGYLQIVIELVKHGANPRLVDSIGRTPLDLAVSNGQTHIVEYFQPENPIYALHTAVQANNIAQVRWLTRSSRVDLNSQLGNFTALHIAAFEGFLELVAFLVENGANPIDPSVDGFTPLHAAASHGHLKLVQFLIAHGAQPNDTNYSGWTPLHSAAQNGHLSVVEYFLSSFETPINIPDNKGTTPLSTAAFHNKRDVCEFLLEQGANHHAVDILGATTIFHAAVNNNTEIIKDLLKRNSTIDAHKTSTLIGQLKISTLHLLAAYDSIQIIQHLIENEEMDVNVGENVGLTPLHVAVLFDNIETINYLITKGANVNLAIDSKQILGIIDQIKSERLIQDSCIAEVINRLSELVWYFNCLKFLTVRLTPYILHRAMGYTECRALYSKAHTSWLDFLHVKTLQIILSISFVSDQLGNSISYIERRRNGYDERPLNQEFLIFAD